MLRLIIAGGRDFEDYHFLFKSVKKYIATFGNVPVEIVSGGAKGVDALGERFANEQKLKLVLFPADWKAYGLKAGPIRNAQMAQYASHLLLFWDGRSKGAKSMLDCAKRNNLEIKIISYEKIASIAYN